jgi:hypothetical protein
MQCPTVTPEARAGIYTLDVGYPDPSTDFASLTPEEREFAQWIQGWWMREGAFNMMQSTEPQSPAFALNDSPVGFAAWLKFTQMERGGHNSSWEVPEAFAADLRAFVQTVRALLPK